MNKRILQIAFFAIIFISCSSSNEKDGLLWKISGNGLTSPSYLFGSHHHLSKMFLDSVPDFYKVFDSINQVIVEMDVVREDWDSASKYIPSRFLPDSLTYSDLLSEKDYIFLDSITLNYMSTPIRNITLNPDELYDRIHAIQVKRELGTSISEIKQQNPVFLGGMDIEIVKDAKEKNYTIISLETLEYQMQLKFHSLTLQEEVHSLICKLQNEKDFREAINGLYNGYFRQDLEDIDRHMHQITKLSGFGDSYIKSPIVKIEERNHDWMKKLPCLMKEKPSLIFVGVGHLCGESSLIKLLRQLGYTVTPIK